jgi:hypothetical protein
VKCCKKHNLLSEDADTPTHPHTSTLVDLAVSERECSSQSVRVWEAAYISGVEIESGPKNVEEKPK